MINLLQINTRARNQVEEKRRLVSALKAGVSPEGQNLFLAITKTLVLQFTILGTIHESCIKFTRMYDWYFLCILGSVTYHGMARILSFSSKLLSPLPTSWRMCGYKSQEVADLEEVEMS
jgi:hypothetical protein